MKEKNLVRQVRELQALVLTFSVLGVLVSGAFVALIVVGPSKEGGDMSQVVVLGDAPTDQDKALLAELGDAEPLSGEFWSPKNPGDTIVGELLADEMQDGDFGPQRVLQLAVDAGVMCVGVKGSMARELNALKPAIGVRLGIQYKGTTRTRSNRDFTQFVVRTVK